jgi:hypothetical protein
MEVKNYERIVKKLNKRRRMIGTRLAKLFSKASRKENSRVDEKSD